MHRAWRIVGLVFTTQFVANAVGFYGLGVVLDPLARDLGVSRTAISAIPLALSIAGAVIGPLMGRAVVRFPIRGIMAIGAGAVAVSFFVMARSHGVLALQLGYGLGVALGLGSLSGVPPSALIVNWFEGRRAFALGIAGIGISLAGAVMTPITTLAVESFGWRLTFDGFALTATLLVPVVLWLAVTRPADVGLEPYGAGEAPPPPTGSDGRAPTTVELLRDPRLWSIGVAAGFAFMAGTAVITHVKTVGTDAGIEPVDASILLSMVAGGAAAAKVVFGLLAARIGERASLLVAIACEAAGLIALAELRHAYAALVVAAGVFGLGMGAVVPLMQALLARIYGPTHFGPASGLAVPILTIFQAFGPPLLGYAVDTQGDYGPGLWALAAAMAVPALSIGWLRLPQTAPVSRAGTP